MAKKKRLMDLTMPVTRLAPKKRGEMTRAEAREARQHFQPVEQVVKTPEGSEHFEEYMREALYNNHVADGNTIEHAHALTRRDMQALGLIEADTDTINKAQQYNPGKYEVIEIADDYQLDAYRFQVIKYVLRCTAKGNLLEDLKKGAYYLNRLIRLTENGAGPLVEKEPAAYHG